VEVVPVSAPSWRRLAPILFLSAALLAPASGPALAGSSTHGFDDDFEYAVVDRDEGERNSTFCTTTTAWEKVDRLLKGEKGPAFWFALDGRSYLVRDASTVAEARRIVEPMHQLGKKQGKLGAKQGAIGARQGHLGGEQGRIGARQGMLGARLASLAARSVARGGRESASLRAERRRIEDEMEELGERMEALSRRHEPLAGEQAALGAQQAELGKQQASASKKAGEELRRLARRAREDGTAQRVD
jgi:hypothetical protein